MSEHILLVGALLLFVAVMAGKVAYRFGAPALLLFLSVGMIFGLNFISFRSFEITQGIGMLALCIIFRHTAHPWSRCGSCYCGRCADGVVRGCFYISLFKMGGFGPLFSCLVVVGLHNGLN